MAQILIVDDDTQVNKALSRIIASQSHNVKSAFSIAGTLNFIKTIDFDVVLLDVRLPDGSGLDILSKIRHSKSMPEVIIMTAYNDENGAELAIKNGAWDYLKKPTSLSNMNLSLTRALQYRSEKHKLSSFQLERRNIIGSSPMINMALGELCHIAPENVNVLISGETGTGKELFARAIHENSKRSHKNFVVVDCAALPETLVESILFGYEKGAFTGADKARDGLILQANEGTLFLDEIGELSKGLQKSFLRVIQERSVKPLGAKKESVCDFRLIAASNRNLKQMVKNSTFRKDLYFRINAFTLNLPPLRERRSDIKDIFQHRMSQYCESHAIEIKGFSPEFLEILTKYNWPGNVRELINTCDRVFSMAHNEPTLFPYHMPPNMRVENIESKSSKVKKITLQEKMSTLLNDEDDYPTLKEFRDIMEQHYFAKLLADANGNKSQACKKSGLSRSQFYTLLKKSDI